MSGGNGKLEWGVAIVIFLVGSIIAYNIIDPYNPKHAEKAAMDAKRKYSWETAERNLQNSKDEGERALEETDSAIRAEASERRARLEKASKNIRTTNKNGVRVDQYVLKSGRIISCTTTISGNSPAIFNCDGDV